MSGSQEAVLTNNLWFNISYQTLRPLLRVTDTRHPFRVLEGGVSDAKQLRVLEEGIIITNLTNQKVVSNLLDVWSGSQDVKKC